MVVQTEEFTLKYLDPNKIEVPFWGSFSPGKVFQRWVCSIFNSCITFLQPTLRRLYSLKEHTCFPGQVLHAFWFTLWKYLSWESETWSEVPRIFQGCSTWKNATYYKLMMFPNNRTPYRTLRKSRARQQHGCSQPVWKEKAPDTENVSCSASYGTR